VQFGEFSGLRHRDSSTVLRITLLVSMLVNAHRDVFPVPMPR
jgi:hypothetical protein